MSIEGINNAQLIQKLKSIDGTAETSSQESAQVGKTDEVSISRDARLAQTLNRSMKAIEDTPEVREDKVAEVQENLEEGVYDSPEVLEEVAEQATQDLIGF